MNTENLNVLLSEYRNAPEIYHPTSYWSSYENRIEKAIKQMEISQIRSGKWPILDTFGFHDTVWYYHLIASKICNYIKKLG